MHDENLSGLLETGKIIRMLKALLKTMRPKQWAKNVFLLAAIVFDRKLTNMDAMVHTILGVIQKGQAPAHGAVIPVGALAHQPSAPADVGPGGRCCYENRISRGSGVIDPLQ